MHRKLQWQLATRGQWRATRAREPRPHKSYGAGGASDPAVVPAVHEPARPPCARDRLVLATHGAPCSP